MKKAVIAIVILLIIIGIVAAIVCCGKNAEPQASGEVVNSGEGIVSGETEIVNVPKKDQIGTAGSNIPLKDNFEEVEKGVRSVVFGLVEEQFGDKAFDVRTNVTKAYTFEDEMETPVIAEMNLGANEVAVEFNYEIKPSSTATSGDIMLMTVPNGYYDEESGWVKEKSALGILKINASGDYIIDNLGTGW